VIVALLSAVGTVVELRPNRRPDHTLSETLVSEEVRRLPGRVGSGPVHVRVVEFGAYRPRSLKLAEP